jgi:4-aminobutyrate aminotransferase
MSIQERTQTERLLEARERYLPRGLSTTPLVVARAEGARIEDVDGHRYIDFAGGLGCHNTGHGLPAAVAAIHEQADRYLHQCFIVGMYEPYIDVCRRLAELSPCRGENQKTLLVNSGAEALENAVKIARVATGRPAVVVFDHAFHGRTLLTLAMTSKLVYKKGFGPLPPEVYRVPGPYPYRGVSTKDSVDGMELLFKQDVDPETVACVVLEPVQGEGGFIPMPQDFPARLREICDRHGILYVDDEVQSGVCRTGPPWAIEHYGVEPDLMTTGKSIGGGLPLGGVTGRAEIMDAVHPGGLGGTFGGNPVSCAAAIAVLDTIAAEEFQRQAAELGERIRARLAAMAARIEAIGEIRGLGPMLAVELVESRETKTPAARLTAATVAAARERGLVLLSCGLYSNVIRILVPLVIGDEDLDEGLGILEESLAAASAAVQ